MTPGADALCPCFAFFIQCFWLHHSSCIACMDLLVAFCRYAARHPNSGDYALPGKHKPEKCWFVGNCYASARMTQLYKLHKLKSIFEEVNLFEYSGGEHGRILCSLNAACLPHDPQIPPMNTLKLACTPFKRCKAAAHMHTVQDGCGSASCCIKH